MPYRPIDFQISVPRAPENASQQSQLNHRPAIEQTLLEQNAVKQIEQQRTRNAAVEQSGNHGITANRNRDSNSPSKRKRRSVREQDASDEQDSSSQTPHPFKGKHIDYSL
ncbi:hypothetical protein [Paenibacillus glycinis]|uniref:Uncharacterized protein n=1 Tax=Paenibacillus glycinis TaxID=2697035 RepID=A0ABW9XIJ4_9BACL|nr:hypothetical protein [Paenibacillus glycinis]NBD22441.1 hypothetical protein [Paenibacillus glycinis]